MYEFIYGIRFIREWVEREKKTNGRYEKLVESTECLQSAIVAFVFELKHLNTWAGKTTRFWCFRSTSTDSILLHFWPIEYCCSELRLFVSACGIAHTHNSIDQHIIFSLLLFIILDSVAGTGGEVPPQRVLVNGTAQMKCDIATSMTNDKALLVVWYKNNLPIYR